MRFHILGSLAILSLSIGVTLAQSNQAPPADSSRSAGQSSTTAPQNDSKLVATPEASPQKLAEFTQAIKDIHFDFDRAALRPEDQAILASNAEWLKSHPDLLIVLEGNADTRGDIVYNLVLSGERASVTRDALIQLGVPADRIVFATGWGKLYPICPEQDESCWSQNRRTHFEMWPPAPQETRVAMR